MRSAVVKSAIAHVRRAKHLRAVEGRLSAQGDLALDDGAVGDAADRRRRPAQSWRNVALGLEAADRKRALPPPRGRCHPDAEQRPRHQQGPALPRLLSVAEGRHRHVDARALGRERRQVRRRPSLRRHCRSSASGRGCSRRGVPASRSRRLLGERRIGDQSKLSPVPLRPTDEAMALISGYDSDARPRRSPRLLMPTTPCRRCRNRCQCPRGPRSRLPGAGEGCPRHPILPDEVGLRTLMRMPCHLD